LSNNLETVILSNLIHNEEFTRKVSPYIKKEYFNNAEDKKILEVIIDYYNKFNSIPKASALEIEINNLSIEGNLYKKCLEKIQEISINKAVDTEWLLDQSEKFCKEKSVYNAIMQSIEILDGKTDFNREAIPNVLQEALAVSFDQNIGHDFIEGAEERFKFYHTVEEKIPFDIEYLNKITRGGLPRKTFNVILAGTGVGKTLMMCHFSAANLLEGRNVLYITLEMAEEKIAERIDANLMKVNLNDLQSLTKSRYHKKIEKIKNKTKGKLIIKQYPTSSVGANHFRHLINELKTKKKFVPDIIYIDYINICASSRIKSYGNVNSYTYIKAISEELRGLAVEFDLPIVTGTQVNRGGFSSTDVDLTDTSESFGLPQTADFMFAVVRTEQLDESNMMLIKQLKNRYNDPSVYRRFHIGVDRAKMTLYDTADPLSNIQPEATLPRPTVTPMKGNDFESKLFADKSFLKKGLSSK
jgi:replicative DNA helicase